MDIFISSLLAGYLPDDEFGYFLSIASTWRNSPEWTDATKYSGHGARFSAKGDFVAFTGPKWAALHSK